MTEHRVVKYSGNNPDYKNGFECVCGNIMGTKVFGIPLERAFRRHMADVEEADNAFWQVVTDPAETSSVEDSESLTEPVLASSEPSQSTDWEDIRRWL